MEEWTADFVNDPHDDYELMVEISYNNEHIGSIKNGKFGLEFIWYEHNNNLIMPFDWLFGLMVETKKIPYGKE